MRGSKDLPKCLWQNQSEHDNKHPSSLEILLCRYLSITKMIVYTKEVRKLLPFKYFAFMIYPNFVLIWCDSLTQFCQYRNIRIFHLPIFQVSTIFWFVSITPRHWAKGGCHLYFFPQVKFLRHESMLEQTNLVR